MRRLPSGLAWIATALTLWLVACQPAPAAPRASAPPAPAAASAPAAGSDWDQVVAAAKAEGSVVCACPAHPGSRPVLQTFAQAYPEIKLEYNPVAIRDLGPRVKAERAGGQYLWDLYVGGPSQEVYDFKDAGFLDPIRTALLLPEVRDETRWNGGFQAAFHDVDQQYVFAYYQTADSYQVNRDLIPRGELETVRELLDPKYRGKMAWNDPRGGGPGSNRLGFIYYKLGENGVRQVLVDQQPAIAPNDQLIAEWAARGQYPILFGLAQQRLQPFRAQGLALNVQNAGNDPEVAYDAAGGGGVVLFSRAPHPNAAKVFLNWLLTAEVQAPLSKGSEANSRRVDVPFVDTDGVIRQGEPYVTAQSEDFIKKYRLPSVELAKQHLR
jgi:ABC-type Fe3+ transport system substrate-binding protein